ncbi:MAG: TolC family protein [Bacteroidota bacterium]|jgi:outer membrane protein TolC|nr:TolC family protein [Bacteroidota bacterium]
MKKLILAIGLGMAAQVSFAQTKDSAAYSFSLQQAIDYAMKNQVSVQNAVIDERIAQKKVNEIMGAGLPQINASFDLKNFIEVPTTVLPNFVSPSVYAALVQAGAAPYDEEKMSPEGYAPLEAKFGTKYQATAGLDASQLLFSGEYFLGLKASKVFVELSERSTQRTRIEAAAAVSKAYYTVLINEERMKLMDANISRLKKAFDDTKALNENGFVEKIDVDRLSVAYNNLLVEQEKINRLLKLGTYFLKYQMGMPINANLTLSDKLEDVKFDALSNVDAQKFDYEKRVDYNLFTVQYKLAKLDLKRQRFSYLPTAVAYGSLSGSAQRNDFDIFDTKKSWYPTALVGGKVTMPIFSGLARNARNQQAKLAVMKAENNLEMIKQAIDLELASTTASLQNAASSLAIQKKNIETAEEVYRVSKIKFEQGVGSNLEMITAETTLKESQTNYFSALFDAMVSKIDFDKANGTLIK